MLPEKLKSDNALKDSHNSNATEKVLDVIDCIFQHESLTFNEIKKHLNIPNATLHRVLYALEQNAFIVKDDKTGAYALGIKFIYYGEALKAKLTLVGISENFIKELAKFCNESVSLSVPYDNYAICLFSAAGEASALTSKLVPISSLNCSASGKLFLSTRTDDELRAYFQSDLCSRRTVNSICSFEDFKLEQSKLQQDCLSFDNEEYEYGLFCITAPIHNHLDKIIASLGVSGPLARMQMRDLPSIQKELLLKSCDISEILTKIKYEPEY